MAPGTFQVLTAAVLVAVAAGSRLVVQRLRWPEILHVPGRSGEQTTAAEDQPASQSSSSQTGSSVGRDEQ